MQLRNSFNHHDASDLENNLRNIFKDMKGRKLPVSGAHFNADSAIHDLSKRSQFFVGATPCGCPEHRGKHRGLPYIMSEKI